MRIIALILGVLGGIVGLASTIMEHFVCECREFTP